MPLIEYRPRKFKDASLEKIDHANDIIAAYEGQGYVLTLRQLFYQFVSRDLIPNTQTEYDNLGALINDARYAGLIDWDSITDRTRNVRQVSTWRSPQQIVKAIANQYREDLWSWQKTQVEVWIEKDALVGVIERPCNDMRVPFFSCRGYTSQSEMWGAAQRIIARYQKNEQETVILHLGDHDPSGIDMSADINRRLSEFCEYERDIPAPRVKRIALNMDQVQQYAPPPNPAKLSDGRAKAYIKKYGPSSWELDALRPDVIDTLIREEIADLIDWKHWEEASKIEDEQRHILAAVSTDWDKVKATFGGQA